MPGRPSKHRTSHLRCNIKANRGFGSAATWEGPTEEADDSGPVWPPSMAFSALSMKSPSTARCRSAGSRDTASRSKSASRRSRRICSSATPANGSCGNGQEYTSACRPESLVTTRQPACSSRIARGCVGSKSRQMDSLACVFAWSTANSTSLDQNFTGDLCAAAYLKLSKLHARRCHRNRIVQAQVVTPHVAAQVSAARHLGTSPRSHSASRA